MLLGEATLRHVLREVRELIEKGSQEGAVGNSGDIGDGVLASFPGHGMPAHGLCQSTKLCLGSAVWQSCDGVVGADVGDTVLDETHAIVGGLQRLLGAAGQGVDLREALHPMLSRMVPGLRINHGPWP